MGSPIRVLECVNDMSRGGLETMLMNYYRHLDRSQVQMDFLVHRPWQGDYDQEILALGGRIFRAPRLYPRNLRAYHSFARRLLHDHPYRVVHAHIDAMSLLPLREARLVGVPVRIAHSHSTSLEHDDKYALKQLARWALPAYATDFWACSREAGDFLFGPSRAGELVLVRNAIDVRAMRFDATVRTEVRHELGLGTGDLVLGHVGGFRPVKNQAFVVDLVRRLADDGVPVRCLLAGDGQTMPDVERRVREMGLEGRVHFLGCRGDVARLLQAMDVFVFPSLFEGVPLSVLEAQAAGLPVLMSDRVSAEVAVLPTTVRLSLEDLRTWESVLLAARVDDASRAEAWREVEAAGYGIEGAAGVLQDRYLRLWEQASSEGGALR